MAATSVAVDFNRNDIVSTLCSDDDKGDIVISMTNHRSSKRETLNIRIKPEERGLIDRAAQARGKSRTEFILDTARRAAEDALLDQAIISVSRKACAKFLGRLDAAPRANERLRKTMQTPAP